MDKGADCKNRNLKYIHCRVESHKRGLQVARKFGYRIVWLESGSKTAIGAVRGCKEDLSANDLIIQECRNLKICPDWEATWQPREGNKLADALANLEHDLGIPFKMLNDVAHSA